MTVALIWITCAIAILAAAYVGPWIIALWAAAWLTIHERRRR